VVIGGQRQVGAVDVAGDKLAAVVADPSGPGEVVFLDSDRTLTLTRFGADLAGHVTVFDMEELTTTASDGYPVHGWLVRPSGPGPHPVLLMIHGGPFAQYGWTFFDEAQVYVDAGYAVVMGNPRGSSGYGHAHGRYVRGDVGARSTPDLLALLDHALTFGGLDADRVGVLGGSHGGYMVNWLLGNTSRFRTGISERSVCSVDSYLATADLGWSFPSLYGEDPEQYARQSPLTYVDRVKAPLLIIHAVDDLRCPLEQAQRFYHALAAREADVEMLLSPGGSHRLSRSGLPSYRIARFNAILDWFGRHLQVGKSHENVARR
jgi:dipeptidyl aminopeptidase/acylaminoacyl peptidase